MLRSDIIAKAKGDFLQVAYLTVQMKGDSQMKQETSMVVRIFAAVMAVLVSLYVFVVNRLIFAKIDQDIAEILEIEEDNPEPKEDKVEEQKEKKRGKRTRYLKMLKR